MAVAFQLLFFANAYQYFPTAGDSADRIAAKFARTCRARAERDPLLDSSGRDQLSP
jgi:hypothetical protein